MGSLWGKVAAGLGRRRLAAGLTVAVLCALFVASSAMPRNRDHRLLAALQYVRAKCGSNAEPISNLWIHDFGFNALYGNCMAGDGRDQHIWFFFRGRFVGTDAHDSSKDLIGIWRDARTMAFMYVLYRSNDPNCCPTGGGKIVRFRWNGKRVIPLDRLPPSLSRSGVTLGR